MEENYIQIFCTFVADLLEANKMTGEDMSIVIQEFAAVAERIHSRGELISFIKELVDYPEFQLLIEQLEDSHHVFIFNQQ